MRSIHSAIRDTKRLVEVVQVLLGYGFHHFAAETGLDRLIQRGKVLVGSSSADEEVQRLPQKVRLRLVLERLGPTFIKLGQILSTRPDLIPPEYAEEFRHLQSDCPAVSFQQIRRRLEEEFPDSIDELFESIEAKPLSAASIAQVHRAVLKDGAHVVLKIIRPGVERTVAADMSVLSEIARFVEHHYEGLGFRPTAVLREFEKQITRELDLVHEGKSTDRLREYFQDDDRINFVEVHWQATTSKVLAMEEIKGIQLTKLQPDDLSPEDRSKVAAAGVEAVFSMCLDLGFFHADPHPGNIFAMEGGKICFIDCGMTGHVEERTQLQLAEFIAGVLDRDLEKVVRLAIDLSDADTTFENNRTFRADMWEFITRFQADSFETLNVIKLLNELFELLREHKIDCPSDLVFLIKALTTADGTGRLLDPSFDLMGHIKPLLAKLIARQYGWKSLKDRFQRSLMGYINILEDLPDELRRLSAHLRRRDFSVRLEHKGLESMRETIEWTGKFLGITMVLAATIISATILIHTEKGLPQWGPFTIVGLCSLAAGAIFITGLLALGHYRSKHRKK
jgi:ubiquinone biosynthesis protein